MLSEELPSFKRIAFICECFADFPDLEVWFGNSASVLQERAQAYNVNAVSVAKTSCPAVRHVAETLSGTLPVFSIDWPPFVIPAG